MIRLINILILTILLFNAGRSGGDYLEFIPTYSNQTSVFVNLPQKQSNNPESFYLKSLNSFEEEIVSDKTNLSGFLQTNEINNHILGNLLHSVNYIIPLCEFLFEADSSPPHCLS